ncbi:hypothetical protein PFISCL1PPCAC_14188, partial [Pristionchus fissidentatus]
QSHFKCKYHGQKVLVVDCDNSVTIEVLVSAINDECLQDNTQLDEVIEVDVATVRAIELVHQNSVELRGETITESSKRVGQFSSVNVTRSVGIETAEAHSPVIHIVPQGL